ncbi:MAG: hypothetical protein AMXMBFR81_11830 [Chthonomonas sp.]
MDQDNGIPSYFGKLTQAPLLGAEEEMVLTRAARKGDMEARQRLIECNMRLVINVAKSYRSRAIPLEDLIQEGAIGLMHATERFDPERGYRFSTYATHWIRQAISRAIDNKSKAIRLPTHISQSLRKIERERARLMRETGQEPTVEQIATGLEMTPARVQALLQTSQEVLSLDMAVGESGNTTLGGMIRDEATDDPEAAAISQEAADELREIIDQLSERERRIMRQRFHLDSPEDLDKDLSKDLSLSRERLRQIELQAIKKLRLLAQRRRLRDIPS